MIDKNAFDINSLERGSFLRGFNPIFNNDVRKDINQAHDVIFTKASSLKLPTLIFPFIAETISCYE